MTAWLTVIGIGDDGLAGLSAEARALIDQADLLVGGERHQAMVPDFRAARLTWADGVDQAAKTIAEWRGRRVVVLATGDPMWYGGGANLARHFTPDDMVVLPHPGAFSLAAARMVWPLADITTVSVHGRPIEILNRSLAPGARLLVLCRDGETPAKVARLLVKAGYGLSMITTLEHLGGANEHRYEGSAAFWSHPRSADLVTLAIECRSDPKTRILPDTPGLPDEAFESDGKMTKREVRAITIAALAPLAGQVLWDVGAGSGSVAIEWLRAASPKRPAGGGIAEAVAIESEIGRCTMIGHNAAVLGVPQLRIIHGVAPAVLVDLVAAPDSIFVGGGLAEPDLLETAWARLKPGGRLVANAVTVEGLASLIAFREGHGGMLTRLAVARSEPVGRLTAFRPLMEVTQYLAQKP